MTFDLAVWYAGSSRHWHLARYKLVYYYYIIIIMEVGLGPVHIVLDGDPAPLPPKKGHTFRHMSPHF